MKAIEAAAIANLSGILNNRGEYIVFLSAELEGMDPRGRLDATDGLHIELDNLVRQGLIESVIQVTGRYNGADETAFMVKGNNNAGLDRLYALAERFRQESVLVVERQPWTGYKQGRLVFTNGTAHVESIGVAVLVSLKDANREHRHAHTLFTTRKEEASCALAFVEVDEVDHGTGYRDIEHIIL